MYDFETNIKNQNSIISNSEKRLKNTKSSLLNEKKNIEQQIEELNTQINKLKKQKLELDATNAQNKKLIEQMMSYSNRIEEIKKEIEEINQKLKVTKNKKSEIKDLQKFSKKFTNLTLIDHIDGNLNQTESNLVNKLSELNNEMKEDLKSMMLANSFYGRVGSEVTQLDPAILSKWKSHEKKISKISLTKNIYDWLSSISPLKLISGSAIGGAAIASVTMVSVTSINTYSVLRSGGNTIPHSLTQSVSKGINKHNIPSQWVYQNNIVFSLRVNDKTIENLNNSLLVRNGDTWKFVLIATEDKLLNIKYVDKNSQESLVKNLKLNKGQTFESQTYMFSPPLVDGELIITDKNNEVLNINFKLINQ